MEIATFLASTVIATIGSAIINSFFSYKIKTYDFKSDYYKKIIQRRISAHEQLEDLVVALKLAVTDDDKLPYHFLFSDENTKATEYYSLFMKLQPHILWLSEELFLILRDIQDTMHDYAESGSVIEFGKRNYNRLAELRHQMEQAMSRDLLMLHDVPGFLSRKQMASSSYREFSPPRTQTAEPPTLQP